MLINDNMLTTRLTSKLESEKMTSNSCHTNYIQSISQNRQDRLKRIGQNFNWLSKLLSICILSVYIIPFVFSSSLSSSSPIDPLVNKRWSRSAQLSTQNNQLELKYEMTENSPAGTLIGVIRSPLGYQPCQPPFLIVPIRSGSHSSSESSSSSSQSNLRNGVDTDLNIDQASGEIRNSIVLDREETSYYTFIAIPFVGPNIKVTITVLDSNDNAPLFPLPSIHLEFPENSKVRDVKRTLPPARDNDLGIFGTQKYQIVSGNLENAFRLVSHREKDDVLYHDLQVNGILDRESTSYYTLIVEALDGGTPPLSSQLLVNISILDVNDNEPIFTQSRYVATLLENATVGTSILRVTATDSDEGSNGRVEYSLPTNRRPGTGITLTEEASYFEINKETGWIYLSRPVDFELKDSHELVVVARDCGLQPLETSAFVSISVVNVNDNLPTIDLLFRTEDAKPIVPENVNIGDFISRILINDSIGSNGLISTADFNGPTTYTFPEDCCHRSENILRLALNISHDHFDVNYQLNEISGRENIFSINSENGLIVLMEPFDFEKTSEYKLNLTAAIYLRTSIGPLTISNFDRIGSSASINSESNQKPIRTISKVFTLKITNVNDERPIFTQSNYNREISESVSPGTLVTTIEAKDADANSDLMYVIPPGHEEYKYFSIDRKTGALKTLISLDRETREVHRIPIFVFDDHYVHATSTVVNVVLLDVNDNQPIFSSLSQSVKILENISPGTIFHTIIASDLDTQTRSVNSSANPPSSLEYSIINGNDDGKFGINRATGQLSTLLPLDRERKSGYNLTIQVSDSLYTNRCNLTIELIDVNDNSPIFDKSVYKTILNESQLANCDTSGTRVLSVVKVRAVDPDLDNSIYYTISASGSPEAMYFTIDPITGLITTDCAALAQARKAKLVNLPETDYASSSPSSLTLSFDVLAIDVGSSPYATHTNKTTIQVTVVDLSDSDAPRLSSYPTIIEVSEKREDFKVGAEIGRIIVAEQRTQSKGESAKDSSLNFTIVEEDTNIRFSDYFNLDPRTGSITVKKLSTHNHHEAFVEVRRNGSTHFTLTLVQVILSGEILSTSATDSSASTKRTRPSIPFNVSLFENVPLGTEVINLMSRYRTFGQNEERTPLNDYQFQFAFTSVNQSTFFLYPDTGIITIRKLLDFETDPSRIELVILARKRNAPFSEPMFFTVTLSMVNVNDNAPRFTQAHYISTVSEGESRGTFVTQISALDVDNVDSLVASRESIDMESSGKLSPGKSTVTYHILEGNHDNAFIIDPPGSGIVKTNIVLDREIRDHYVLTIVANDEGPTGLSSASRDSRNLASASSQLSSHCTLEINVIDINDNVPVFPPYQEISVLEDAEVGATVASLTANDVDTFPPLTYYQKRSHLDGSSDNIDDLFDIGLYTGRITLKSRLDQFQSPSVTSSSSPSTPNQYKIAVLASDSLNTIETQVVIKVKPKNIYQRPPVFEHDYYFVPIKVDTHPCVLSGSVNCKIVQVSTSESEEDISDTLPRLKVTYKLAGGPSTSKGFYIDSYTGSIYNNRSLSRLGKGSPTGSMFQLTVIAGYTNEAGRFISGHKAKSSVLIVIPGGINITNSSFPMSALSDQNSRDEQTNYSISVKRDSIDQILLKLDRFKSETFTLTNGNTDRAFALIRGNELIMTKKPTRSEYKLTIFRHSAETEMMDENSNHPITLTVNIKVQMDESGNTTTAFKSQIFSVSISETSLPGHQVISVRSDSDHLSSYRYSIYSGNEMNAFKIDEVTGIITINKSIDYETKRFHQLTIMAKPFFGSHNKTDFCLVNIEILNENANRLKLGLQSYKIIVDENTPIGTPVVKIMASDSDMSSLNYTFLPSIDGLAPFGFDSRSGYIVTTDTIDYESLVSSYSPAPPTFKMILKAVETAKSSAEVLIEVSIASVDEYPPRFTSERYDFKVTTSYGISTVIVGQISATDGDLGPDGQVVYSIRSSSPPGAAKKFSVNSTTGLITITTAVVDKIPPHFTSLVVSASSGRAGSLNSLTRIAINLILTGDKLSNDISQSGPLYDGSNFNSSTPSVSSLPVWVMFLIISLFLITCVLFVAIFAIRSHLFEQSSGSGHHHHHHATGHHHQSFMTTSALASIVPGVGTLLRKIDAARGSSGEGCTHIGNTTIDSMNDTSTTYDHASFQGLHLVNHHHGHAASYLTSGQHNSLPPCYNEVNSLVASGSTPRGLANRPGNGIHGEGNSASSGRGSAEEDEVEGDLDGVDEEVRMINEGDGYHTFGIDNLGPTDEHELIPSTAEYLARLVIFDPDVAVREDDVDTLAEEVQSKAGSESKGFMTRSKSGLSTSSLRDRKQLRRPPIIPPIVDESEWNDLSCIEEELSDAYSWDYLADWAPQYQPLANVYTEIATLKGAIHYDNTIGSSSSGLSDSPAYMRTSSTPAGDDNHHETNSLHSHSTTGSKRSAAHLTLPSTSSGHHRHHPLSNNRLSTLDTRGSIPPHESSSSVSNGSAFIPFGNRHLSTNDGFPCDNRLKGIASDSSSDASTATAVFVDNDSSDQLRI